MSKIAKVCEYCKGEYMAWRERQRFCSKECQYASTRTRVVRICQRCGQRFTETPSRVEDGRGRFCSKACYGAWQRKNGPRGAASPFWNGGEVEIACEQCGLVFTLCPSHAEGRRFCSSKCWGRRMAETGQMRGAKSPTWQGGLSFEPYPQKFNLAFKKRIRERDGHTCAICRLPGKSVHHINYAKDDMRPENFITLCRSCHMATNFSRPYWQRALSHLLSARLTGVSV